ncbi:MAG: zinc ribbon domain-containing protein [Conexivisphaera sp.]|jgi:putative transposase
MRRGNKYRVNMCAYRELMGAIEAKAREYGITVHEVFERGTSSHCAYHDVEVKRHPRGVVTCPVSHRLHLDLNDVVLTPVNSVAPAGGNAQDPGVHPNHKGLGKGL